MNFTAPYLPWVLLGFSVILGSSPGVDLLGLLVGENFLPLALPSTIQWKEFSI